MSNLFKEIFRLPKVMCTTSFHLHFFSLVVRHVWAWLMSCRDNYGLNTTTFPNTDLLVIVVARPASQAIAGTHLACNMATEVHRINWTPSFVLLQELQHVARETNLTVA